MSLVRPLGRLSLRGSRALSTTSATQNAIEQRSERDPRQAPAFSQLTKDDVHKPIVFRTPVPRLPNYPTTFPDAPVHEHINYPHRVIARVPPEDRPQMLKQEVPTRPRIAAITGLSTREVGNLTAYKVVGKRVVNMTKKGKISSFLGYAIVGSPEKGLVGVGRGRASELGPALDKAVTKASLSMDYVSRFENRTLWGQGADLTAKFGATTVTLRSRPPGFGLQVPHVIHRVLSAAGIRDASASIRGSRNEIGVINATIQILHGGFGPPGFGSGKGTRGRKQDKGAGMRSVGDIERQRGRYGVDINKRR